MRVGSLILGVFALTMFSCSNDGVADPCSLKPDPGNCEAAIPKFYFDNEERRCKKFSWGGCGGVVPFDTLQECMDCVNDE